MKFSSPKIVSMLCFLLIWCSGAYCQTYQEVYNLDFSRVEDGKAIGWSNFRYKSGGSVSVGTADVDGKKCLRLNYHNLTTTYIDFGTDNPIVLPERLQGELEVSLSYMCDYMQWAVMYVYASDPESGAVYADSVKLQCGGGFVSTSVSLDAPKARVLDVRIIGNGKEYEHFPDMSTRCMFIEKLEIACGGHVLNNAEAVRIPKMDMKILNKSLPVELSGKDGFDDMNVLDADVLGIGFGMFEDSSLPVAVAEILKRQIAEGGCRTVVAEFSVVEGLYLNRYVSGDEDFTRCMIELFRNDTVFLNLIEWIKGFNVGREDKVRILGLNIPVRQQWSVREYSLPDARTLGCTTFLQTASKSAECDELDSLINILTDEMRADVNILYQYGADYITSNLDKFDEMLGCADTRMIRYFLLNSFKDPDNYFLDDWNPYSKDSLQYVFFRNVVRTLIPESSPIVFLGCLSTLHHSEAVNPWNRSLGCRLREEYGKRYVCLGIISDRPRKGEKEYVSLENSLDALCRWAHSPYLYVDCRKLGGLVYVRSDSYFINSGEYFEGVHEFYDLICPKSFMDGMLVVK